MGTQKQSVLSVNVGSSSIKFAIYRVENNKIDLRLVKGKFDNLIANQHTQLSWQCNRTTDVDELFIPENTDKFDYALEILTKRIQREFPDLLITIISHRIVHGGNKYSQSVILNETVFKDIKSYVPLAPLHQPHNIDGISIFKKYFPSAIHVVCFDTAFHHTMSEIEKTYAIPLSLKQTGIIRYGFHGLSYQYLCQTLSDLTTAILGKSILMHLGNGASICACINKTSIATSMGFSTLDGLIMGTRCGSIDPGVLTYLLHNGWSLEQLEDMLYNNSGLKGVSGISSNMKELRESPTKEASFAIELFSHEIIKHFGSLYALLNGLDVIVFSGGIGEHDAQLRNTILERLSFLNVVIDIEKNNYYRGEQPEKISSEMSKVEVWVVPADEEYVAATEALNTIFY
ncbi:acetate/propionate family kinase [Ferrovum sp. PN-J185]|uniref:acetate/propionate family kinase n=1 Tax=Ferrovum sp. PN-J185 TaxID=1356306 RepID=UPI001E48E03E|nr:acetate/propionate family kinase [Ferrovum sp. PN-J185]MCC6067992.1 acetate/propionate family kinase [Ferrovum sp. PN-J185]